MGRWVGVLHIERRDGTGRGRDEGKESSIGTHLDAIIVTWMGLDDDDDGCEAANETNDVGGVDGVDDGAVARVARLESSHARTVEREETRARVETKRRVSTSLDDGGET